MLFYNKPANTGKKKQQQELSDLKSQMDSEEQQLKNKADATSTDLNDFNKKLKAARAEQARQEELKKKQTQQTKKEAENFLNGFHGSSPFLFFCGRRLQSNLPLLTLFVCKGKAVIDC